jgi:hypothetical protein
MANSILMCYGEFHICAVTNPTTSNCFEFHIAEQLCILTTNFHGKFHPNVLWQLHLNDCGESFCMRYCEFCQQIIMVNSILMCCGDFNPNNCGKLHLYMLLQILPTNNSGEFYQQIIVANSI